MYVLSVIIHENFFCLFSGPNSNTKDLAINHVWCFHCHLPLFVVAKF